MPQHQSITNKKKIINDPVYGFISIPDDFVFDLIEHPYFQRLRRIKQLGLTHLVYPGALHTRFHHVIGAMHLMSLAIATLRRKGHEITLEEEQGVLVAILLHDIGHGPFSHALEHSIVDKVSHEEISSFFIERLSKEFGGKLDLALLIFQNKYTSKPFLHQLVSSQLDMDRLDYLNRDSFYTGVSEGVISSSRIIEMLNVFEGNLVMEEKGVYSIEKFLVARRLMYWQVYMHKTVVVAEDMLIQILRRAKFLSQRGEKLFASPALSYFLEHTVTGSDFKENPTILDRFALLDDDDVNCAIKVWASHSDKVLSFLSERLMNRKLSKIEIAKEPFSNDRIALEQEMAASLLGITVEEASYFVTTQTLTNNAYNQSKQTINLLCKNNVILDVSMAADNLNLSALASPVEKFCLCFPVR